MPSRTPIWTAIRTSLSDEIVSGRYPSGARLPSEAGLSARFGVNRHTVRRALKAMAEAGLVHPRRGAGVFVTARPTDYPIGRRVRFHQNLRAAGRTPERRILLLETRAADPSEAEALAIGAGAAVHVCEGLSLADGQPLAHFRSVFPADFLPGLLAALEQTSSVTAALASQGVADYTRAWTRLDARLATATRALHLRIGEGAPILRSVSLNVDLAGRPVEYGRTWFAGDRVTLTLADDQPP